MLLGHHAVAQRHYVYLQSDDRRPFSVRIGSEVHSSNATGYVIIPRLADSNYVLRVGYPQGDRPTAVFPVQIAHRDHGYQLGCTAQECVLVDLQDASRIKGVLEEVKKDVVKADQQPGTADVFTNSLALAIGDPQLTRTELIKQDPKPVVNNPEPAVKGKTVVPSEEKVVATQAPRKDAPSKAKESAVVVPERAVSGKEESMVKKGVAEKAPPVVVDKPKPQAEPLKKDSAQAIAVVRQVDTMNVKQDPPKEAKVVDKAGEKTGEKAGGAEVSVPVVVPPPVKVEDIGQPRLLAQRSGAGGNTYMYLAGPQMSDTVDVWIDAAVEEKLGPAEKLTEQAKADIAADLGTAPVVKKDSVVAVAAVPEKVRTDCKARATAKDVDALKKKLGGVRDEDEKVAAALAGVKARCYDTEQLKALCGAFARNEGKYKLMDAAYPYIYDPGRYGELEGLLTDPYFVHRLKVLTGAINR